MSHFETLKVLEKKLNLEKGQELRVDETSKQLNWSLTDQQPLVVFSEDFAVSQGELRLSQLPDLDDDFYHFSHLESTTVGQTSEVAQRIHDIDTKVKICAPFCSHFFRTLSVVKS